MFEYIRLWSTAKQAFNSTVIQYYQLGKHENATRKWSLLVHHMPCNPKTIHDMEGIIANDTLAAQLVYNTRMLWVMPHDWGRCAIWHPNAHFKRRERKDQDSYAPKLFSFTTFGDSNTNCFNPYRGAIIPPQ